MGGCSPLALPGADPDFAHVNQADSIDQGALLSKRFLGRLGHVIVSKHVVSTIYIVAHMWPLCSAQIWVDGVNQ